MANYHHPSQERQGHPNLVTLSDFENRRQIAGGVGYIGASVKKGASLGGYYVNYEKSHTTHLLKGVKKIFRLFIAQ